jgi:hypothetical protein
MLASASTAAYGYGHAHQQARTHCAPTVAAGEAECAEMICLDPDGRHKEPGPPQWRCAGRCRTWNLAHDRVKGTPSDAW